MKSFTLAIVAILFARSDAVPRITKQTKQLKDFTLNEVISSQLNQLSFNGTWLTGNEFVFSNQKGNYVKYNIDRKLKTTVLKARFLKKWPDVSVHFITPEVDKVLIQYDARTVFRHSTLSKFTVLDITSGISYDVANAEEISVCKVSPNGQSLAYVKDNNVYYRAKILSTVEIPLTTDGVPGVIYNGAFDWVYEEEVFETDTAFWFSNDGSHIAMASFNDTNVKEYSYQMYGEPGDPETQYPVEHRLRYPKVNTTNPTVHLKVMNLANTNEWIELPAPEDIVTADHILGVVNWIGTDLGAIWLNRRQNIATYQRCNVQSTACTEIVRFNEPKGWYILNKPICASSGERCFLLANSSGWQRVWEINGNNVNSDKSPERYTVSSIIGYDEIKGHLYYTAVPASAPQTRHVYRDGQCLTCSLLKDNYSNNTPCTYASVSFSTDYSYFVATCSGPTPSYSQIYRTSDLRLLVEWESNEALRTQLAAYKETEVRFLKVPVKGGFEASVRLYLPAEIDFEKPDKNKKKYPMIVQVYGGPNSAQVIDTFTIDFGNYLTTTKKIIYCQIDGRGTANQGYAFLFALNNRLGTVEIKDQIAVTKYLQDTYSFIDRKRTGIWGWSYGGFVTSLTLEKDSGRVFKCGISVAPVTSWMFYDSVYTERYMGLPQAGDNKKGYRKADVSKYVNGMRNHMFLLIHGNADDNVHYQNSMVFVRALVDENIEFQQMFYPDEDHALGGVSEHLYHTMDKFWNECFTEQSHV